ncbi:MAG: TetR/AcrR family transcriptional regulator [Chitinophagales bacterium]
MNSNTANTDRKTHIRNIAQNLFRKQGYAATSMRNIADEVGIKAASLYNHFKNGKEEILADICFDIASQFFEAIEEVKKMEVSPTVMLGEALKAHVKVIMKNLDASAVFLHEWRSLDAENLQKFKAQRKRYERDFHQIVEKGIEGKEFKNVDVHFFCLGLFSAMNWLYDWYRPDGKLSPDDIADQLFHLLLDGLKA